MSFALDAFHGLRAGHLPDSQIAAQRSRDALRGFLTNDYYFTYLALEAFLNGSYGRLLGRLEPWWPLTTPRG